MNKRKLLRFFRYSFLILVLSMQAINHLSAQSPFPQREGFDKGALVQKSINNTVSSNAKVAACTGITLTPTNTATNSLSSIIQSLVGSGVTISNIQTNLPASSDIYGSFSCGTGVVGIEQGLILTTGSLTNAMGPNSSQSAGRGNGLPGNALLNAISGGTGFDASVVSFNITPTSNTLTFNYVFASDEYNDFVGSSFNDAFGFFISGPGIVGTRNIALLPGTTTPVTINNVNKGQSGVAASNPQFFINNDVRTLPAIPQTPDPFRYQNLEYDGLTVTLAAVVTVVPGQTYTLTLAIQDVGDGAYDSGVFIEGGSVQSSDFYYSKSTGDLHNVLTWGKNLDGSGENPPDFGPGKTFNLANRPGIYTLTNNWTVGGTLNIPAASQLQISSYTLSIATITGTGSFSGTTASNLIVTQPSSGGTSLNFVASANALNNLSIVSAATTTLTSALNIYGVLTLTNGTLNTGNVLTLKSSALNTARVAPVTGSITGTVTVERYVPARRAWRIMSAPVGGSQTINAAWQEGATTSSVTPDPNPGYGTHITEGSAANGLDHNPLVAMSSIKRYASATDTWTPLANTNATAVNSNAFMLFVRGHRSTPLGLNTVPATITTLRATGPLKVGDQMFPVSATGFTAVPNPFASPINFATLTKTNVQNTVYLWDPKVGGTYGVGGYVTVSFNGSTYDVSSNAVSPESQYIQSGQGFLVRTITTGTAGSITIKESDKSNTAATDVFRTTGSTRTTAPVFEDPTKGQGLRMKLQTVNEDRTTAVLDEIFASYKSGYANKVDQWDAVKPANIGENLGMVRDNQTLVIERKSLPVENETLNLKLWNTAQKSYTLEFNPINLSATGLYAYLEDKYLKTSVAVSLDKISQVHFTISSDAASARADRFSIVFSKNNKLENVITKSNIIAYPNPVNGRSIGLQFSNLPGGTYQVTIVNSAGRVMLERSVKYVSGAAMQTLQLDKKLPTGVYKLQVAGKDTNETIQILSQ